MKTITFIFALFQALEPTTSEAIKIAKIAQETAIFLFVLFVIWKWIERYL